MYGKEDTADALIEKLSADKDTIMRCGGIYTIAEAYTPLPWRIVAPGVRWVSRIVQLLSESYSPHVRYGGSLALGISCAGTGSSDGIELLEPMTKGNVDSVRQGALAMILIQ
ncbi:proteasome regulatory particle base subunit [Mortierella sp. AD094]|nr:proteasome regulatory particle base subunit [Mortierella sp. AD094]